MSEHGHLGAYAHAKALALKRGVKSLTVMRQRLYVNTATLGDQHHRHKKMPSIIF